jgi:hypothetical protein
MPASTAIPTVADSLWARLITHPNHPEWPSAHGSVSGALTHVIAEVLGKRNDVDITIWGGENGSAALSTSRQYDSIKDIRDEVADARVWGGFHYRGAHGCGPPVGREGRAVGSRARFPAGEGRLTAEDIR